MPRLYEPLWERLKETPAGEELRVAIPIAMQRRVIKAVMKERTMDLGFKYQLLEKNKRCKIAYRSVGSVVFFRLKYTIGLEDIL